MVGRRFGEAGCAALLALVFTCAAAGATGTTRVQRSDGSSAVYHNVNLRLVGRTLWIRSDDRDATLEVASDACSFAGPVQRCLPSVTTLHRGGTAHEIALRRGTVYINTTDSAQPMRHSSEQLGPHAVMVLLNTVRGTVVSVHGTLDEVK